MCLLQHALSDKAQVKTFDPKTTCLQECLITTFQEAYFVSESFEEAKEKMRQVVSLDPSEQLLPSHVALSACAEIGINVLSPPPTVLGTLQNQSTVLFQSISTRTPKALRF